MTNSIDWKRALWVVEVGLTALVTLSLLPTILFYVLDLTAGIVAPDAEWGFGAAIGLIGIWVALLARDSLNQPKARIRWAVVVALVVAVVCLARLAWGFRTTKGASVTTGLLIVASTAIGLHQLIRLLRRSKPGGLERAA